MAKGTIVFGVCGGIAAYKAAEVVSALAQEGREVTVIMTEFAQQFVSPLTFQTLSGRRVVTGYAVGPEDYSPVHISLASAASVMVVAPATANIIGKFAHGIADDILTTVFLSMTCHVIIAPAMNENMYNNPAVKENISLLKRRGVEIIEPGRGRLACGAEGVGRLAEPEKIVQAVHKALARRAK